MAGNFKHLLWACAVILLQSCSNAQEKDTAAVIIKENISLFVADSYGLTTTPVIIQKSAGRINFINEDCEAVVDLTGSGSINTCKESYLALINEEDFSVNEETSYISYQVAGLPSKVNGRKVSIQSDIHNTAHKDYVLFDFTNTYIDEQHKKAFIILKETDVSPEKTGGRAEVYFFEKVKDKWLFKKKKLLVTS